jgi:hypothetical protein
MTEQRPQIEPERDSWEDYPPERWREKALSVFRYRVNMPLGSKQRRDQCTCVRSFIATYRSERDRKAQGLEPNFVCDYD